MESWRERNRDCRGKERRPLILSAISGKRQVFALRSMPDVNGGKATDGKNV
jgi:hypothetical protein